MSFPDLRAYINWLDECGEVVRIKESVSTKFDIARHEEEHDGKKTVYFENVAGFDMPVVAIFSTTAVTSRACWGSSRTKN